MHNHWILTRPTILLMPIIPSQVCVTAASAQEVSTSNITSQSKTPLQGGITQDGFLPGLADKYKEGSPLDKADLQKLTPDNN